MKKIFFFFSLVFFVLFFLQCENPFSSEVKSSYYEELPQLLSDFGGEKKELAWSEDGESIVYVHPVRYYEIYHYTIRDAALNKIGWVASEEINCIQVSPDNQNIIYYDGKNICQKVINSNKVHKLEFEEEIKYIRQILFSASNIVLIHFYLPDYSTMLVEYDLSNHSYHTYKSELIDKFSDITPTENRNVIIARYRQDKQYYWIGRASCRERVYCEV